MDFKLRILPSEDYILLTVYMKYRIFNFVNINPTNLFAALAHSVRLRSLLLLVKENELCVCELTHAIKAAQPNMSRHLAYLREAGLVVDRREGLWIHYRINPKLPDWAIDVLRDTFEGVASKEPFASDATALAAMPNRRCVPSLPNEALV